MRNSDKPVYQVWEQMKSRCQNQNATNYAYYGGRGIRVCRRWQDFKNFLADMGEPEPGMTLDRIDNNGHYTPSNCRWVSWKQQHLNKRNNVRVEVNGQAEVLAQLAADAGISSSIASSRIRSGWSVGKALATPIAKKDGTAPYGKNWRNPHKPRSAGEKCMTPEKVNEMYFMLDSGIVQRAIMERFNITAPTIAYWKRKRKSASKTESTV